MRLTINIPDKVTIKPCTFYFTVDCNNGDIEVHSMDYFKAKYGIEFRIEKGAKKMTNGEKIEEITGLKPFFDHFDTPYMIFHKAWWDAEYKESEGKE